MILGGKDQAGTGPAAPTAPDGDLDQAEDEAETPGPSLPKPRRATAGE